MWTTINFHLVYFSSLLLVSLHLYSCPIIAHSPSRFRDYLRPPIPHPNKTLQSSSCHWNKIQSYHNPEGPTWIDLLLPLNLSPYILFSSLSSHAGVLAVAVKSLLLPQDLCTCSPLFSPGHWLKCHLTYQKSFFSFHCSLAAYLTPFFFIDFQQPGIVYGHTQSHCYNPTGMWRLGPCLLVAMLPAPDIRVNECKIGEAFNKKDVLEMFWRLLGLAAI